MNKQFTIIVLLFSIINLAKAQSYTTITDSIFSETLNENRNFWVHLPENYNPEDDKRFPVVYLLDGYALKNSLLAVYNNYWGHYLPNMILVGISNRENRTRDLTTSKVTSRYGGEVNEATGGAENFTQFIKKELINYIDNKYKTTNYRTLIGHSYGGLFTINMLVNHKDVFKNYIAIDPGLDWDNQKLLKEAKEKLKTENFKGKSLFLSLAAEQLHMMDETVTANNIMKDTSEFTLFGRSIIEFAKFSESINNNGLRFSWKVYPEDLHGTVPLPSIRDGLVYLFKWFQFKTPPKYNNPETTVEEIKEMLIEQGKIYTDNFGYETPPMIEELFNGYGYMNLQMGFPEKAKLFFEMGIKYYPNSANAYDSYAEYLESVKEYKKALEQLNKAYNINKTDYYKKRVEEVKSKI